MRWRARQGLKPLEPALEAYQKYLEYKPDSPTSAYNYGYCLSWDGQVETAVDLYRRPLQLGMDAPEEVHLNMPDEAKAILTRGSLDALPEVFRTGT